MVYWSDEIQADPSAARAAAPALTAECLKCWTACPKKRDCCNWMVCWSENRSLETWRAYNYPHVVGVYWSLYRLARHYSPPLATRASWTWYLLQAARTSRAMWTFGGNGSGVRAPGHRRQIPSLHLRMSSLTPQFVNSIRFPLSHGRRHSGV